MRLAWDIFCTVIDNYGDIGICWRLARQLRVDDGQRVRLWVDDLTSFVETVRFDHVGVFTYSHEPGTTAHALPDDVPAATKHGVIVVNAPLANTLSTAEHAFGLMLAVARNIPQGHASLQAGQWNRSRYTGVELNGKTLGVVGLGRIGKAVARRAAAFGLQIHYHNRKPVSPRIEEELSATYWESLDQMLARMDIVSVNCPHTPATFHLLSARRGGR